MSSVNSKQPIGDLCYDSKNKKKSLNEIANTMENIRPFFDGGIQQKTHTLTIDGRKMRLNRRITMASTFNDCLMSMHKRARYLGNSSSHGSGGGGSNAEQKANSKQMAKSENNGLEKKGAHPNEISFPHKQNYKIISSVSRKKKRQQRRYVDFFLFLRL